MSDKIKKAGLLPYRFVDGVPYFLFMKSSDAFYGGPLPQISKGGLDDGETFLQAAYREAEEELGLHKSDVIESTLTPIWDETFKAVAIASQPPGIVHTKYWMVQVSDDVQLSAPHYETESVHWMSWEQFKAGGRVIHQMIVKKAVDILAASA